MKQTFYKLLSYLGWMIVVSAIIIPAIYGFSYYDLSIMERPYSELHHQLKPGGFTGHWFGVAGSMLMIIGVVTYSTRKRTYLLYNKGSVSAWLKFHIFCCSLGPVLVIWHTAFKLNGLVSISFWSMIMVVLSGVIGRFFYTQIPRTRTGIELDFETAKKMIEEMTTEIFSKFQFSENLKLQLESYIQFPAALSDSSSMKTIKSVFSDDLKRVFSRRDLITQLKKETNLPTEELRSLASLLESRSLLARKLATVKLFSSLLHYWHVFHLPFALIMLIIMLVHVGVALWMGYGYNLL